ncbi:hypothetical protein EDB89DRAFT_1941705 [Lactarius sanguifluus]|nr:hypothetical protein EDB89DRAFT_1941705 [Lactarius sanguifluus]
MSTPPIPPHIEELYASEFRLLGVLWNWTLYGVLVVQLYVYSYNFPGDRTLLKLLVYSVFLVETLQTALTGADLYYWFVSGFGNMDHLSSPHLSAIDVPIIGSIVTLAVQLFFMYRIWILSGRSFRFICLFICLCSAVAAVAAFSTGVYSHVLNKFSSNQTLKILTLRRIWLSGNSASDLLIVGSMLFHLGRRRREGDGYFSDHAISRVVRLTVETNVLTGKLTDKPWFTCPIAILGKL